MRLAVDGKFAYASVTRFLPKYISDWPSERSGRVDDYFNAQYKIDKSYKRAQKQIMHEKFVNILRIESE